MPHSTYWGFSLCPTVASHSMPTLCLVQPSCTLHAIALFSLSCVWTCVYCSLVMPSACLCPMLAFFLPCALCPSCSSLPCACSLYYHCMPSSPVCPLSSHCVCTLWPYRTRDWAAWGCMCLCACMPLYYAPLLVLHALYVYLQVLPFLDLAFGVLPSCMPTLPWHCTVVYTVFCMPCSILCVSCLCGIIVGFLPAG